MQRDLLNAKLKAFSIHVGISLAIFVLLLFLILFQWYPPPFFSTDGGWQGLRLIIFVDLVLGPSLTFIVFNPQKLRRLLKMDLTIIAICQILALSWGIWAVHNERPYLAVFADGAFYTLPYYQLKETGLSKADIAKFDIGKTPIKIYVDIPTDKAKYFALLTKSVRTEPFQFMGDLYQPFDHHSIKAVSRYSINMQAYIKGEAKSWNREYQHFVNNEPRLRDMLFLSLHGRYGKYIVVFDSKTLTFRKVLDIPPPGIDEIIWGKQEAMKRRIRTQQLKHALTRPKK